jgi:uncharacterized protein
MNKWIIAGLLLVGASSASAQSFYSSHPDQTYRNDGLAEFKKGNYKEAAHFFRLAARYAEKSSQFSLGLLYLEGQGVEHDPASAYAWLDLASERGYPQFLAKREEVWNMLTAAERDRAVQVGTALYAEYGDSVAKPRLEQLLIAARRNVTGSHTGFIGSLYVHRNDGINGGKIGGGFLDPDYYADWNWKPGAYWQAQDNLWQPSGNVEVGPLRAPEVANKDK